MLEMTIRPLNARKRDRRPNTRRVRNTDDAFSNKTHDRIKFRFITEKHTRKEKNTPGAATFRVNNLIKKKYAIIISYYSILHEIENHNARKATGPRNGLSKFTSEIATAGTVVPPGYD